MFFRRNWEHHNLLAEIYWPLVGGHLDFWIWYTHWMEKFLQNFGTSTNTCLIWCKGDFISDDIFKLVQSSKNQQNPNMYSNDGGTGGATSPQFLADQLTLFHPGGQNLSQFGLFTLYYWPPQFFHYLAWLKKLISLGWDQIKNKWQF